MRQNQKPEFVQAWIVGLIRCLCGAPFSDSTLAGRPFCRAFFSVPHMGALILVNSRVCLAGLDREIVALMAVPACEMCVMGRGNRILQSEMPFCFPVMMSGFFVVMRGIMVMA